MFVVSFALGLHGATVALCGRILLATALEGGAAGEVAEQDLALGLELRTDEAQAEQEASECVLLVVGILFLCGDTLSSVTRPFLP